jgi:hypothetical protein
MNGDASSQFHDASTYNGKFIEYGTKILLKIHLNQNLIL